MFKFLPGTKHSDRKAENDRPDLQGPSPVILNTLCPSKLNADKCVSEFSYKFSISIENRTEVNMNTGSHI